MMQQILMQTQSAVRAAHAWHAHPSVHGAWWVRCSYNNPNFACQDVGHAL